MGNVFTALLSWLSVRSRSGRWILRIEDLDPQRSRPEYAQLIEDDLNWLGLDWDEGGTAGLGPHGPYSQSRRSHLYDAALQRLIDTGYVYPCTCTRADLLATSAPHQSDGRRIYGGRCRPASLPCPWPENAPHAAARLWVPSGVRHFIDRVYGPQQVDLATECGDFVLRRADGAWAYQLAVAVDDNDMGVNEIVRGNDLLLSVAQQDYLRQLLDMPPVEHAHVPLVVNDQGIRLSKRDQSLSMEALRTKYTPQQLTGILAHMAGIIPNPDPATPRDLAEIFDWSAIHPHPFVIAPNP